jgi:hypothetical protein
MFATIETMKLELRDAYQRAADHKMEAGTTWDEERREEALRIMDDAEAEVAFLMRAIQEREKAGK